MRRIILFCGCFLASPLVILIGWNLPIALSGSGVMGWQSWMTLACIGVAVLLDAVLSMVHVWWIDAPWPWQEKR